MQEFDRLLAVLLADVEQDARDSITESLIAELRQEVIEMKLAAYKRGLAEGEMEREQEYGRGYSEGIKWATLNFPVR